MTTILHAEFKSRHGPTHGCSGALSNEVDKLDKINLAAFIAIDGREHFVEIFIAQFTHPARCGVTPCLRPEFGFIHLWVGGGEVRNT